MKDNQQSRRMFVREIGGMGLACATGMLLIDGCAPTQFIDATTEGKTLIVQRSEIGSKDFVVVRTPELKAPVYLKKIADDKYRAVHMLCTHKGCKVKPNGPRLYCPCHGSEYDERGIVLKGPAREDLQTFSTMTTDKSVVIQL